MVVCRGAGIKYAKQIPYVPSFYSVERSCLPSFIVIEAKICALRKYLPKNAITLLPALHAQNFLLS